MNKVIATDLDGTLFYPKDHKEMICSANLFFLQSFIDKGGKVILVTGRSSDYGLKVIERIGRECSIIAYNGASIYDDKKMILEKTIPNDYAIRLVDECLNRFNIPGVFLMTDKGLFIHLKAKSQLIRFGYKIYYSSLRVYAEKIDYEEESYENEIKNGRIFKIMLYFGLGKKNRNKAANSNKLVRELYKEVEASWSTNVIEITAKGTSKARALENFCKNNNIDKNNVFVVGDSGNDISMFKAFHENSFCMSHATDSVKKYAKYSLDKFEDLTRYIYEK